MKCLKPIHLVPLCLLLVGCSDLKVVRDYARESAQVGAYTTLAECYRDTYRREQPYLDAQSDAVEREIHQKRQATYADLMKLHQTLTLYMQTLGRLAGDDAFSVSKDLDSVKGALKADPEWGLSKAQVDAYAQVAQITAHWASAGIQERLVREMVEEADPHIQVLLAGMKTLVACYRRTRENEKRIILGVFEVQVPFTNEPKDVLLNRMARAHLQAKTDEFDGTFGDYAKTEAAITRISEGHAKLRKGLATRSMDELKQSLPKIAKEIRTLRESLEKARN